MNIPQNKNFFSVCKMTPINFPFGFIDVIRPNGCPPCPIEPKPHQTDTRKKFSYGFHFFTYKKKLLQIE